MKRLLDDVRAKIRKHGFTVISVGADEDFPPFSYTVGLAAKGLPELVMVGLHPEIMHPVLLQAAARVHKGEAFEVSERKPELIANFDCLVGAVVPEWFSQVLRIAFFECEDETFSARQIIWPDANGVFPGEPDFDARFGPQQPLLAVPPEQADEAPVVH